MLRTQSGVSADVICGVSGGQAATLAVASVFAIDADSTDGHVIGIPNMPTCLPLFRRMYIG